MVDDAVRAEAEAGKDRLCQRERFAETRHVVARLCAQQETHRAGAIGKGSRDGLEADLRHLVDRERQHVCGQPVAAARQRIDQRRAVHCHACSSNGCVPPASR